MGTKILLWIQSNPDTVALIFSLLLTLVKIWREKLKFEEAVVLVINTLKDEDKMKDNKFAEATLTKLNEVAETISVGKKTADEVGQIIAKANEQKGFKIGSYKGRPVYIQEAIGLIGGLLRIFKR